MHPSWPLETLASLLLFTQNTSFISVHQSLGELRCTHTKIIPSTIRACKLFRKLCFNGAGHALPRRWRYLCSWRAKTRWWQPKQVAERRWRTCCHSFRRYFRTKSRKLQRLLLWSVLSRRGRTGRASCFYSALREFLAGVGSLCCVLESMYSTAGDYKPGMWMPIRLQSCIPVCLSLPIYNFLIILRTL